MKNLKRIVVVLLFFSFPFSLSAFQFEGLTAAAGTSVILNAEPVDVSPAPAVTASVFGISASMLFTDVFYFEPGLRFYGTRVILVTKDDNTYKAVPAAIETRDRMGVLNIEFRPELGAQFRPNDSILLGLTAAPVFTFRLPITSYDDAAALGSPAIVREYYFSKARFFGLYAGLFFGWNFGENTSFIIKAGTNVPIYHFWDGDSAAFYDQLAIQPEIGMRWRF